MIAQFSVYALDALLASTLIYLFVLTRRLKSFRQHERHMRRVVEDLVASTDQAREAIAKLKLSTVDAQSTMRDQIGEAKSMLGELDKTLTDSKSVLASLRDESLALVRKNTPIAEPPARVDMALQPRNRINLDEISDLTKSLRTKLAVYS